MGGAGQGRESLVRNGIASQDGRSLVREVGMTRSGNGMALGSVKELGQGMGGSSRNGGS